MYLKSLHAIHDYLNYSDKPYVELYFDTLSMEEALFINTELNNSFSLRC